MALNLKAKELDKSQKIEENNLIIEFII